MPEEKQVECSGEHKKRFVGIRNNIEYYQCIKCSFEWGETLPEDDPAAQGAASDDDDS